MAIIIKTLSLSIRNIARCSVAPPARSRSQADLLTSGVRSLLKRCEAFTLYRTKENDCNNQRVVLY